MSNTGFSGSSSRVLTDFLPLDNIFCFKFTTVCSLGIEATN